MVPERGGPERGLGWDWLDSVRGQPGSNREQGECLPLSIFELADDTSETTVRYEAELNPTFNDNGPSPRDDQVTNITLSASAPYPLE